MFALVECICDSAVYNFTYITMGLDDREWHHTTPISPLANWVDEILIPLAREGGNTLTAEQVVQALNKLTQDARISFEGLDWLGLALLTTQRYRETLGQLAVKSSPETQEEAAARKRLSDICCQIYQQLSLAQHDSFRRWLSSAA